MRSKATTPCVSISGLFQHDVNVIWDLAIHNIFNHRLRPAIKGSRCFGDGHQQYSR